MPAFSVEKCSCHGFKNVCIYIYFVFSSQLLVTREVSEELLGGHGCSPEAHDVLTAAESSGQQRVNRGKWVADRIFAEVAAAGPGSSSGFPIVLKIFPKAPRCRVQQRALVGFPGLLQLRFVSCRQKISYLAGRK